MFRRTTAVACLAVLITLGTALPWLDLAPRAAAASCSNWTSQTQPPPTIRVFRHLSGAVETVDFRTYAKNVLSREWIGSWTTESLRSGALAVKHYAWYQVLHWRGGVNGDGECFDLRDDTVDQVYDPSKPTWSTAAAAVDATWGTRVHKGGAIFPTYYNAGATNEACGANANGWRMFQWGTQGCGLAGRTAAEIVLIYYYPGVSVTGTPAPTPIATPLPTPSPTAIPTPTPVASPGPTASIGATPVPTPPATVQPTVAPTPNPLPTPPPDQAQPGGGQAPVADSAAPPSPPPADPNPVVAGPGALASASRHRTASLTRRLPGEIDADPWRGFAVASWLGGALRPTDERLAERLIDVRLAVVGALWRAALRELVEALALELASGRPTQSWD